MLIVHALLEVAAHPEYDIASMTFNFWPNLQICLIEKESYVSLGNESLVEMERSRRLQVFRSSYASLVSLVSCRVQYPRDYSKLSKEDQKDFKKTRYNIFFSSFVCSMHFVCFLLIFFVDAAEFYGIHTICFGAIADVLIDAELVLGGEMTPKIL